jgi:hypothetical protein
LNFHPSVRRGERHPNSKLTDLQIEAARELAQRYDPPVKLLGKLAGVSEETMRRALKGETYRKEGG